MNYVTLTRERNRRLTAAVRHRMAESRLERATEALLDSVLDSPVDRGFFVSVDHIIVMERLRREGKLPRMTETTQKMWGEIFTIFDDFRNNRPGSSLTDAAVHVVARGRASRFFITRANARSILRNNNINLSSK